MAARVNAAVVSPAASHDLTTPAVVKTMLGITDGSADALLGVLIPQCSAAVARYCNRVFVAETVRDIIRIEEEPGGWMQPAGMATLQLSRFPVLSVTSVTVGSGEAASPLTVDVDFEVIPAAGQLLRLLPDGHTGVWPAGRIVVQYDAGYATVPADIQDATTRLVAGRYWGHNRDPFLKSVAVEGVESRTYWVPEGGSGGLPPEVTELLDRHRVPVLA